MAGEAGFVVGAAMIAGIMATSRISRRTTVPVASREREQKRPKKNPPKVRNISLGGVAIIVGAVLLVLIAIAVPLRNYYEGRTEIARLTESIAAKEAKKERLLEDIARYQDEDFIRQEARRRLGVVEQGETAWRILDPRMTAGSAVTTPHDTAGADVAWYETLWESVAQPPTAPAGPPPPVEEPVTPAP